jgi:hypothetical protein
MILGDAGQEIKEKTGLEMAYGVPGALVSPRNLPPFSPVALIIEMNLIL